MLPALASGGVDSGSDGANSAGVLLTANASANTKATSWTTLIASLTYPASWWVVGIRPAAAAAFLVDIGVGASTSEQTAVANLGASAGSVTALYGLQYLIPLNVAAGERISARCQSSTGGATCRVAVSPLPPTMMGQGFCGRSETLGADTTNTRGTPIDPGGSANTDGSYASIGTTGFHWKWINVGFLFREAPASASAATWLVDIATGAGNQIVIPDLYAWTDTGPDDAFVSYAFPCAIASGSSLTARARCSITNATDRIMDIILTGSG